MSIQSQQLWLLLGAGAGAIIFWLIGIFFASTIKFNLGRGNYAGALPFLGAITGAMLPGQAWSDPALLALLTGATVLSALGFLRDRWQVSYRSLIPYAVLATAVALYLTFAAGTPAMRILTGSLWAVLIVFSLKIAAMVYEMPFILLATSGLTQFIYFARQDGTPAAIILNIALLMSAILMLAYSASGRRVLIGSSGIFCSGFLLAAVSQIEGSGQLLLFALFLPSMVILFPFALICGMIITSYFGNRLHKPSEQRERQFAWSLRREQTVIFAGLIFLCLNFFGLLVLVDSPSYGYFSLFLLLIASLFGFFSTFARRSVENRVAPPQIEMLGTKINAVLPEQVLNILRNFLMEPTTGIFHVITADSLALVRTLEEERFNEVMQRAELVVPDGAGIVWAADFLGTPLPGRVPGVALVSQVCERSVKEGWKVFFLGGKPGIAEQAAKTLADSFAINICGIQHGYFSPDSPEELEILEIIAAAKPDIIFVALGVPRQEWFITRLRSHIDKAVAIGVGGSFDVISQTLPRAPVWMQQFGIEWLFRLWLEPLRFMRMLKIPVFVLHILRHKWNSNDQTP